MSNPTSQFAPEEHAVSDAIVRLSDTGRSLGIVMTPSRTPVSNEIPLSDVLVDRVRAGAPIHITGPLDGPAGQVHLDTIRRLRAETGLPVHVIFS